MRLLPLGMMAVVCAVAGAQTTPDSTWRDHDRAARAARQRGDWADVVRHASRVDSTLHGHPRVILALARAYSHLGDSGAAMRALMRLADMGIAYDVAADTDLALVRDDPRAAEVRQRLLSNAAAFGRYATAATMPQQDFVAEGIAYDSRRARFLVSSIRYGIIAAVDRSGHAMQFADLIRDSATTPLGLALDSARDRLWVATSWVATTSRAPRADSGRAGVVAYDLGTGRLQRRLELPRGPHQVGDICSASDGDLFVSDGHGAMYVARRDADSLHLLVPNGAFVSPQGCAVTKDGRRVYVADYALGIAIVDAESGAVSWAARPPDVALNGIDGLILDGERLVGVQNGVPPNRLVELQLDCSGDWIMAEHVLAQDTTRIVEPTHLVRAGDAIYFIANGGFGMYDDAGALRADAKQEAPRIARLVRPAAIVMHVDTSRTKASLLAADSVLAAAVRTGGSEALLREFASDAVVLAPGQPVMLASAFRSGVTQSSAATASFVWRPTSAIASTDGRFGCTYGVATYPPATASDSAIAGVYATCWRRDSDGQWRIVAHQHNQRVEIAGGDWPTWSLGVRPHSAVYAFVGDAGQEAQLADADFAKLAAGEWGPGPAFSRFIGDDGLLFGPPEFPSGPGGAERAFAEFPPGRVLAWGPLAGFGSGGLAVTVGHASTHSRVAGAADLSRSKYLTIWRQRADGRWEYVLDFGSGRP